MNSYPILSRALAAAFLVAVAPPRAAAQATQDGPHAEPRQVLTAGIDALRADGAAIDERDGRPWAVGPGYKAEFAPRGPTFFPALGEAAPRLFPLGFELVSVRREIGPDRPVEPAVVDHDGRVARYRRGDVVETYAVSDAGIEQSFSLEVLPPGEGDLVVTGRLRTELEPRPGRDGSLDFVSRDGHGGISYGAVTGVDARGERCPGSLHPRGDLLELRVPAAFVDRAQLPLLVDPLIRTLSVHSSGQGASSAPDVAVGSIPGGNGPEAQNYLVVWEERFSSSIADIRGRLIGLDGIPLASEFALTVNNASASTSPAVACVPSSGKYVVAWVDRASDPTGRIVAMSIDVLSSLNGPKTQLGPAGPADPRGRSPAPDVGGDATLDSDIAIVVWGNAARRVGVHPDGSIVPLGAAPTALGPVRQIGFGYYSTPYGARISRSGGATGHYLIAWNETISRTSAQMVLGNVFTRDLERVYLRYPFTNTDPLIAYGDHAMTVDDLDGDGTVWTVSLSVSEPSLAGAVYSDFGCVFVLRTEGTFRPQVGPVRMLAATPLVDEDGGDVTWSGNSSLVTSVRQRPDGERDAFVWSMEPFLCADCEGEIELRSSAAVSSTEPAICSRYHAGADDVTGDALAVWTDVQHPDAGDISGALLHVDDGVTENLGGRCGTGGWNYATCARAPNPIFGLHLRGASLSRGGRRNAILVISPDLRPTIFCNGCAFQVDPDAASAAFAVRYLNAEGNATVFAPIRATSAAIGIPYYCQWLVPGDQCRPRGWDMSNALRFVIE